MCEDDQRRYFEPMVKLALLDELGVINVRGEGEFLFGASISCTL